jgi:general stress protein 26
MIEIKKLNKIKTIFFLVLIFQLPSLVFAQEIKSAAKQMMETSRYCALITLDETGQPDTRIMDPFLPGDDMVIWFGTNLNSRKIRQIKNDLRVTLYYQSPNGVGYTVIKGKAYLVEDTLKKQTYWKKEWSGFYSDNRSNYTLIKIIPDKLEILDYQHGITGDSNTWAVPFVEFKQNKSN